MPYWSPWKQKLNELKALPQWSSWTTTLITSGSSASSWNRGRTRQSSWVRPQVVEALGLVLQKRPDIEIVDLMMPRLNGLELTRRIKEERPQTKILLMSAYTEDTYRRIASVSGADGFVNKHLIRTGLLPAIREVIGRPPSILHEPPPSSSPPA